jgi:4'-phosphopantetheinyl transferase EntD
VAILLASVAPPGVLIDHRLITSGDEWELLPAEAASFTHSAVNVRRRSGSARIVARALLGRLGVHDFALVRAPAGGLIWPAGLLGSISHDDEVALAAVARTRDFAALGVDVEPPDALPEELISLVATPAERRRYSHDVLSSRMLFAAKEAVFKAVYPIDGIFLDFHDVEVDLGAGCARLGNERKIAVSVARTPRTVAVAFHRR